MADNLFQTPNEDPTLAAVRKALEAKEGVRTPSRRVGGSSVGDDCLRKGWMSFRWASAGGINSVGLLAINDGHRSEDVMAELLRAVPGVQLWTEDHEKPGEQISFELVDGHFVGKLDGVIVGIIQAPKTPHVWEHKAVNQKKFDKLKKDIEKFGEKQALEQWDKKYFVQAQMYMHGLQIDRHYLTVSTPGCRDFVSVRTEYQIDQAIIFENKAKRIAYENRIPSRLSQDPAFFGCKFCDHHETCHGSKLPLINCRTCAHSTAVPGGTWTCEKFGVETDYEAQQAACKHHRFHPDLVPGVVLVDGFSPTDDVTPAIVYQLRDGTAFRDDNKVGRPDHPMVKMAVQAPAAGDWYCGGCGVLASQEVVKGETDQCAFCSGAFVECK